MLGNTVSETCYEQPS